MDRHTPSSQSGASSRQTDLFGYRKPRAPRRYLAHMSGVGDHNCFYEQGNTCVALIFMRPLWLGKWLA
ncbi:MULTISPECIES: hypothetical protein [Acetobacter]|nr:MULTISPECIES: hypothetical protein [Acetobacter]